MQLSSARFIEDWSTARENLEYNFRWTRRNLSLLGVFGIAIPILVYKGIVREFVSILEANLKQRLYESYFNILSRSLSLGQDESKGICQSQ